MNGKFVCCKCGGCCKNLRRNQPKHQAELDKANLAGPMYHLLPAVQCGLAFFSFEKEVAERLAKQLNVKATFSPELVLIDDKRKKVLVLSYSLDENDCPFLGRDNLCQIYEHRPIICRQYPLAMQQDGENSYHIQVLDCPNADLKKEVQQGTYKQLIKKVGDYFGYDSVATSEITTTLLRHVVEPIRYLVESKENPHFRAVRKPLKYIQLKLKGFEFVEFHNFIQTIEGFEATKKIWRPISQSTFTDVGKGLKEWANEND